MNDQTTISDARAAVRANYLTDETALVKTLSAASQLSAEDRESISAQAAQFVRDVRGTGKIGIMESFLAEYGLSTDEGVALMCLAEAMLRVPDSETVDALIRDKITPHDWASHIGDSGSILVNASTWALMLTGKVMDDDGAGVVGTLHRLVRRLGEPMIRKAVGQAMAEMGSQFVLGETIDGALKRGDGMVAKGYTYSYDMLGEAARTDADALRFHAAYAEAIKAIASRATSDDVAQNPGISVKLSALHPRYEQGQRETMLPVLSARLLELAQMSAEARIGFNIDAEEADRLDLSLDVIEQVLSDDSLAGWDGFGVVVQAFGRRVLPTIDWLYALAVRLDRRIMVRLVKGAYWDMEIKRAQVQGLADYPVFTRKTHTDVSYLAAARKLLSMGDRIYPQFATHNAHSVAAVLHMAQGGQAFEFQRLHGMGEALHETVRVARGPRCRIYAPVGAHEELLAYLVRRLLENGANSSFVNQIVDTSVSAEEIASDPIAEAEIKGFAWNPAIPRPADIFAPRRNSTGWDITDPLVLDEITKGRTPFAPPHQWQAGPITPVGDASTARSITNPADPTEIVGNVTEADASLAKAAVTEAIEAQPAWAALGASKRAKILRNVADTYEANAFEVFALTAREAGKTLLDGVAEIREAVDFLRYYADETERAADAPPPRGVIVCISPWNFPLAIFTGQISAALAAGNAVIAKPAEQTPLIAARAVSWMLEAGVPEGVIQLLPGDGTSIGAPLTADPRIKGVCFTGSTEVAKTIDRQLAQSAPDAMLIAETGGLNAMIVDSTALLEQATRDIVRAAFQSAGQRCSALRVLYVQEDVADKLKEMLFGAMEALMTRDPWDIAADVAPVIDAEAHAAITAYVESHRSKVLKQVAVPDTGLFVPPTVIEVSGIEAVEREIFGPVLHLATFKAEALDDVINAVNAKGYALTFGLHTRIDARVQHVLDRVHVGNSYVNRDQIGAVVGSQPFGGHGLSGTGPKAGGPHYLPRLQAEPTRPAKSVPDAMIISDVEIDTVLATLAAQPLQTPQDCIPKLRAALRGKTAEAMSAVAAMEYGPVDLSGPTGEANQFALGPRGTVLCLGPDPDALMAQCVQALGAGNRVIAIAPDAARRTTTLSKTSLPFVALDGAIDPALLAVMPLELVAVAGDLKEFRRNLSQRPGPIVPVIDRLIDPASYCAEKTICIDTTAAGGNASLLAETEA